MPEYKRRKYLVKRIFQLKYTSIILFFILLTVFLSSTITYYTIFSYFSVKLANVYPQSRLISVLEDANLRLFYASLAVAAIAIWFGIALSHRIAGPWHRLETILHDMAKGNIYKEIKLRKADELRSLADAVNTVMRHLQANKAKTVKEVEILHKNLTLLNEELESAQPDIAKIKALAFKLQDSVANLKISFA